MAAGQWVGRVFLAFGERRWQHFAALGMCVLLFTSATHASSMNAIEEPVTRRHHQRHHDREKEREPREENGYCAPYNGKVCKQYITGQVWYSLDDPTGGWKNEQVTTALWDELISDLSGLCREAAEVG